MTDSLGRSWQLGTVQLDYSFPERFDLTYTGADNAEHRPVMIHRALVGSFERFIGILIEHFAGELPLWLAPAQAIVLPIADRHNDYAARGRRRAAARPGCGPTSTTARSRSGARSATPSCARSPTCSWSATARPRRARSRCGATARATWGRCRSTRRSRASSKRPAEHNAAVRPQLGTARSALIEDSLERSPRLYFGGVDQAFPHSSAAHSLTPRPPQSPSAGPSKVRPAPAGAGLTRINERIRVPEVRLIDETGAQVGIMKTPDALKYAQEQRSRPRRGRP